MSKPSWFESSQMQALNPALVMLLIPFNNLVLFPALRRAGYQVTALRRMTAGIAFSGVAWIAVGLMQVVLDRGTVFTITWQILPYALLTLGEVLVSATGLEFAYSQAPPTMKGAIMSFWLLSVTIGNLWVLVVNLGVQNQGVIDFIKSSGFGVTAFQMFFFAVFAFQEWTDCLRRNIAAACERHVRMKGAQVRFESNGQQSFLDALVQLEQMRMAGADADPDYFRPAFARECSEPGERKEK